MFSGPLKSSFVNPHENLSTRGENCYVKLSKMIKQTFNVLRKYQIAEKGLCDV